MHEKRKFDIALISLLTAKQAFTDKSKHNLLQCILRIIK